jgi:hypothetical protein
MPSNSKPANTWFKARTLWHLLGSCDLLCAGLYMQGPPRHLGWLGSCEPLEEGAAGLHIMHKHAMRVKCLGLARTVHIRRI